MPSDLGDVPSRPEFIRLKAPPLGVASLLFRSIVPTLPAPTVLPPVLGDVLNGANAGGANIVQDVHQIAFPITEHCITRGIFAGVGGFVMGLIFGAAFASFGTMSTLEGAPGSFDPSKLTATQALKDSLVQMKTRGWSTGKNFGVVGGLYSSVECVLEKQRGKKDMKNAVVAGAATGALLAARAGPKAMVFGASTFAAFSVAFELLMPSMFSGH